MKTIVISENCDCKHPLEHKFTVSNKVYNTLDNLSLIGGFARFRMSLVDEKKRKRSNYHELIEWLQLWAFPCVSEDDIEKILLSGYYNK